MNTIIINSSSFDKNSTNRFRYRFPHTAKFKAGAQVALQSLSMYNSIFNVETTRGNNTISLIWNAGNGGQAFPQTFNWVVPDGYYSVSSLNYWLQNQMLLNGLYATDTNGNYIYFAEIATNFTKYGTQLNLYPIPTSASATTLGYTRGSTNWNWPASAQTPQLIISSAFGSLLGITANTYPNSIQSTIQNIPSTVTPQLNPVNSIIMTCNLTDSDYCIPTNVFYTIPISVGFGGLINVSNNSPIYNRITPAYYNEIVIEFLDQAFNRINMHDNEVTITLSIQD